MTYDAAAFGALALALTVLGGVVTFYRWRKYGIRSLLRGTAWSLLPIAAWLTGVLRLLVEIADAVGHWAVRLVFSPTVWIGLGLAGVCVVLFVVSGLVRSRPRPQQVRKGTSTRAVPPGRPAPGMEGMDDIEEILRRHGIS